MYDSDRPTAKTQYQFSYARAKRGEGGKIKLDFRPSSIRRKLINVYTFRDLKKILNNIKNLSTWQFFSDPPCLPATACFGALAPSGPLGPLATQNHFWKIIRRKISILDQKLVRTLFSEILADMILFLKYNVFFFNFPTRFLPAYLYAGTSVVEDGHLLG